jgi:predicted AlkP superfamily phosphohydrolase/phosphomutase
VTSPLLLPSLLLALGGCGGPDTAAGPDVPGVFVLGVDGVDPTIVRHMMDDGRLPAFSRLASEGSFQLLGTSTPPQSPVAWSSFITGMDPGGHGIYDFVHRDPENYTPISSATPPPSEVEPAEAIEIAGMYIPTGGGEIANNRGGVPFWDYLHAAGVDVEVYRIPGNYPTPSSEAKVLGGMGVVDMRGGYGTYTWYTDKPILDTSEIKGEVKLVTVQDNDLDGNPETVISTLEGPPDLFHLPPGQEPHDGDYLSTRVTVTLDPEEDVALVQVGDAKAVLLEGEWSPWLEVSFEALPAHMMDMQGAVRFYAKELRPGFELYASPVQIHPGDPAQVISSPDDFATEIYERIGGFYTQGLPEETNALKDRLFDDGDYLSQVALVQQETQAMLDMALENFERGDMSFVYMSDLDLQCHMLWRHKDPKFAFAGRHPAYEPELAQEYAAAIFDIYEHVDRTIARVREALPPDTLLIVMSDHGFGPQTRSFHLNGWLREAGYLVMKDGKKTGFLLSEDDVDWARTKAYGVGFNGLYINLAGREAHGAVSEDEAAPLMREIARKLEAWIDPETGRRGIYQVDSAAEVYSGARVASAPDLIVGYDIGYAASDETTLGEVTELVVEDNTTRWSGNHLGAAALFPGVLLVDRELATTGHDLTDLPVTILEHFGLPPGEGMVGESIFPH